MIRLNTPSTISRRNGGEKIPRFNALLLRSAHVFVAPAVLPPVLFRLCSAGGLAAGSFNSPQHVHIALIGRGRSEEAGLLLQGLRLRRNGGKLIRRSVREIARRYARRERRVAAKTGRRERSVLRRRRREAEYSIDLLKLKCGRTQHDSVGGCGRLENLLEILRVYAALGTAARCPKGRSDVRDTVWDITDRSHSTLLIGLSAGLRQN